MRWPARRWAFSLRTLLVLIAALCGWLGWERSVVERRKAARTRHAEQYLFVTIAPEEVRGVELATIPRLRGWLFGDEPVQAIMLPPDSSQAEVDQLARVFPEARVDRWKVQEILQPPVDGIR